MSVPQSINGALRRVPAWPIYLLTSAWIGWLFYLGVTGGLGPEPIKEIERELGRFALQVLIAVLAVTPLRKFTGISLIKFRRALGLSVSLIVAVHLSVWLILDVQDLGAIWKDIVKRPYITIGMVAFVLMIPLAITSNNLSLRKIGPLAWKKLHWLTYAVVVLGAVHFVMVRKGWQIEPLMYLLIIVLLLVMRIKVKRRARAVRVGQES